jgi:aspartyl-tRNA(Asn)/glutamyl-tRNA(Gln) amidotransferase subunit A
VPDSEGALATDKELAFSPAWRLRELIVSKSLSPVELTELYLRRIDALDPQLHAYLTVVPDQAMAAAREAEQAVVRGNELGPLHGIPVSIKDLEMTKGIRSTAGCYVYRDRVPDFDSIVVERLRGAGAIILGKTNTPEFGTGPMTTNKLGPDCLNPWDVSRTPGGSSGGAAAAQAAGLCALAIGSDGGGSTRIPASFCGLYGHKATNSLVPRWSGAPPLAANQFSASGPITRYVRDGATMLQVLAGFDRRDTDSIRAPVPDYLTDLDKGVAGLKIGWGTDLGFAPMDPQVTGAIERTVQDLGELGASIEEMTFDPGDWATHFWTVYAANAWLGYSELYEQHKDVLSHYLTDALEVGMHVTGSEYSRSLRFIADLTAQVDDLVDRFDVLVLPTTAIPAYPTTGSPTTIGGREAHPFWGSNPFCPIFNITGHPSANVPCGFVDGLPAGAMFIGPRGGDALVLRAAAAFEQARPWSGFYPMVS